MELTPKQLRRRKFYGTVLFVIGIDIALMGSLNFFEESAFVELPIAFIVFIAGIVCLYYSLRLIPKKKPHETPTPVDTPHLNKIIIAQQKATEPKRQCYCANCRSIIMEGSKFCPECGKQIDSKPGSGHIAIEIIEEKPKEYFRDIIFKNFSNYTIQEDVPVTQLTGDINDVFKLYKDRPNQVYKAEWGRPYDFVLFDGDKVKAVIMLGNGHSHSINVKYLISKMFAKKLKVPYISFYTQFPNKEDYVINRINEYLE